MDKENQSFFLCFECCPS